MISLAAWWLLLRNKRPSPAVEPIIHEIEEAKVWALKLAGQHKISEPEELVKLLVRRGCDASRAVAAVEAVADAITALVPTEYDM